MTETETEGHATAMQRLVARAGVHWIGRFAALGGHPVHWVEAGDGPPLLLLHGFLAWSFTWRRNLADLSQCARVIAPDLRGFGLSAKPANGPYGLDDQAAWALGLLDHLGIDQTMVCGHSMGGEIALRLATDHPERVQGLILVSSSGYVTARLPPAARLAVALPGIGTMLARPLWANRRFAHRVLAVGYHRSDQVDAATVRGYALPAATPGSARALPRILAQADFGDRPGLTQGVRCPTLVVWGRHDPWLPLWMGERMHGEIVGSELVIMDASGHLPPEEEPAAFNGTVRHWLRQQQPQTKLQT